MLSISNQIMDQTSLNVSAVDNKLTNAPTETPVSAQEAMCTESTPAMLTEGAIETDTDKTLAELDSNTRHEDTLGTERILQGADAGPATILDNVSGQTQASHTENRPEDTPSGDVTSPGDDTVEGPAPSTSTPAASTSTASASGEIQRPNVTCSEAAFGVELTSELKKSTDVPLVLMKCFQRIEKWCKKNKDYSVIVYTTPLSVSYETVKFIRDAILKEQHKVDLSKSDVYCVAVVARSYLMELPDPLIPVELYDTFIGVTIGSREEFWANILGFLDRLPTAHLNTLTCLINHLRKLIRFQSESRIATSVEHIIYTFCNVIMRPPWERMGELEENTSKHIRIIYILLRYGDFAETIPAIPTLSSPLPPQMSFKMATELSQLSEQERLRDADWYWCEICQEEIEERMKRKQNGTFLVRNSFLGRGYTLIVRYNGLNKILPILYENFLYGLVEPTEFTSVPHLISWYNWNNLKNYDVNLNTFLSIPILRDAEVEHPSGDFAKEVQAFKEMNGDYMKKLEQYTYMFEACIHLRLGAKHKSVTKETLTQMKLLVGLQLDDVNRNISQKELLFDHKRTVLQKNYDLIVSLLKDLLGVERRLDMECCEVIAEMDLLLPQMKRLKQKCLLWKKWIEQQATPANVVEIQMRDQCPPSEMAADLFKESKWFVECEQYGTNKILKGKVNGTFLAYCLDGYYFLAVIYQEVTHTLNVHRVDGQFGLLVTKTFPTLKEMVMHYHYNSLLERSVFINTWLLFPVYMV